MILVFIGDAFYIESGTEMSSIYEARDGELIRSDWGQVEQVLKGGGTITGREATEDEMAWAYKELGKIRVRMLKSK